MRAATTAPSDSDVVVSSILGRVFAGGAGAFLGVSYPSVPVGASNYPVLSSGVVPANAEGSAAANQTAATLTANVLDPTRLTAEYLIRYEDLNKFRMMEEALRADLQGAMTEAADAQIIAGQRNGSQCIRFRQCAYRSRQSYGCCGLRSLRKHTRQVG